MTAGSKQRHLADLTFKQVKPLLFSTVVIFQEQNRETINSTWNLLCPSRSLWWRAWQDCVSQHNTRPARPRSRPRPQCEKPKPKPIFWVSDRSCPKTDSLGPHHCLGKCGWASTRISNHSGFCCTVRRWRWW